MKSFLLMLAAVPTMMTADPNSIRQMRWERRVLIVSAPQAQDPALAEQRDILARWKPEAAARDLSLVEIVGSSVSGVASDAKTLRRDYRLPAGFTVLLIGKDAGVKLRRSTPIAAETLARTIDAMPMRRAGER